jgi:hypothetical protein
LKVLTFAVIATLLSAVSAVAQTNDKNVDMFGYFQAKFEHLNPRSETQHSQNSFTLQQLNLMISKDLDPQFSAFLNFQLTNSYLSEANWGTFGIQEAWVKYYHSNALNVKAGLLVPTFNNLNELKDRTPLLPYVFRPFVYEESVRDIINTNDFVFQRAYLQGYGFLSAGESKIDYAVYVGNSEPLFINSQSGNFQVRGADTTTFKMIGGRLGIRYGELKVGVSVTFDKEDLSEFNLGAVQRERVGGDLSYHFQNVTFEGEIIDVLNQPSDYQKAGLGSIARVNPLVSDNMDKLFYYGLVNYDFSEKTFGYVRYSYLNDKFSSYINNGVKELSAGGGYRPINSVVLKAQYFRLLLAGNRFVSLNDDHFLIAVSVLF